MSKELTPLEIFNKGHLNREGWRIVAKSLKAFEIIKECFDVNGFDELIPNEHWWKIALKKRNRFLKEMLK